MANNIIRAIVSGGLTWGDERPGAKPKVRNCGGRGGGENFQSRITTFPGPHSPRASLRRHTSFPKTSLGSLYRLSVKRARTTSPQSSRTRGPRGLPEKSGAKSKPLPAQGTLRLAPPRRVYLGGSIATWGEGCGQRGNRCAAAPASLNR